MYPEWYRVEKETEKTIEKLSSVKELIYYLQNTDESIRRLAILRLGQLKLKNSIEVLMEVLQDPLESAINKDLAAWVIKSVSVKWGIDLFTGNALLSKYTGNEKISEIYKVSFNEASYDIKYEFCSDLINSELQNEPENLRISQDVNFDSTFSFKGWLKAFSSGIPAKLKACINFKKKKKAGKKYSNFSNNFQIKRFNPLTVFKNIIVNFLIVIFFPVRLILKHKFVTLCVLATVYCFLAFTVPGNILAYKYFGVDLFETQSGIFNTSRDILKYAWDEAKEILGINAAPELKQVSQPPVSEERPEMKQCIVTAKSGLNLRTAPDSSSDKVTDANLEYNSRVFYLLKSQKDNAGREWLFVQTQDGKTGWVYSKWIKETEGGENAGQ